MAIQPAPEWISTGAAAQLLGYAPAAFRRKFYDAFLAEEAVIRPGGHYRWLESLVLHLRECPTSKAS